MFFSNYISRLLDPPPSPDDVPYACNMTHEKDIHEVRRLLLQRGICKLIKNEDVHCLEGGRPVVGGVFGI